MLSRAYLYLGRLTDGACLTVAVVADLLCVHSADVSRILPLAFLAPEIVERILDGTQPVIKVSAASSDSSAAAK